MRLNKRFNKIKTINWKKVYYLVGMVLGAAGIVYLVWDIGWPAVFGAAIGWALGGIRPEKRNDD